MANPMRKQTADTGKVYDITTQSAGWDYVGFGLYHLKAGEQDREQAGQRTVLASSVGMHDHTCEVFTLIDRHLHSITR